MKTISFNIATLRKHAGLSQQALAGELNITRSRLSSWEEHRAEPGIDQLINLSEYFQKPIDDLIKTDLRKCI
jgi:transcriptional regulator with XRE-family HTH domain